MYVKEFLNVETNKLYTDNRGLFDNTILQTRILLKFSYRTIRDDLTPEEITAFGQNVIDSQSPYLSALFDYAAKYNPMRQNTFTTEKAGNSQNTENGEETTTNTGTVSVVGNATDTPNSTTNTTKSAYNATESRPAESVSVTGENTTNTTGTTTNNLSETHNKNDTANNQYSETVTVSGVSSAEEIATAFEKYIQPYDYLAREIINAVCAMTWE